MRWPQAENGRPSTLVNIRSLWKDVVHLLLRKCCNVGYVYPCIRLYVTAKTVSCQTLRAYGGVIFLVHIFLSVLV